MAHIHEKCKNPDDPRRCIAVTRDGQCRYISVDGKRFCEFHVSELVTKREVKESVNRFLIEREEIREIYQRHNTEDDYLELKDTISLIKTMIERRFNHAKNEHEEIAAFRDVDGYTKNLVSVCTQLLKIQQQMGLVIGKDELRMFAKEIGAILSEELEGVEDKEGRMDRICEKIFTSLDAAGKKENQNE